MLTITYPWVFLLLPLPWLVRRFLPPHRRCALDSVHDDGLQGDTGIEL